MKNKSWFSFKGKLKTTLLGGLFVLATSLSFGQAATLPYTENFTASAGWMFANGSQPNKWFIGSATGNSGNSLYISDDVAGATNNYRYFGTPSATSITHAYKDVAFPSGGATFNLKFDFKANGEYGGSNYWDFLRVWVIPSTVTPTAGTSIVTLSNPDAFLVGDFYNSNTWTTSTNFTVPSSFSGTTGRLVFEWLNDNSGGNQAPAAIDNISISSVSCSAPTLLTVNSATLNSATLAWTPNGPASSWEIEYLPAASAPTGTPTVSASTNPFTITGLTANTEYKYYVRSVCSVSDKSVWSGPYSFVTGYCDVSTTDTGDYISSFSTTGAVDNLSYVATGYPTGSYSDQTALPFSSFQGQIIDFTQTYELVGNNHFKIWVDWNNDFDFTDAGEQMYAFNGQPHLGSFTVPLGVAAGTYRVRIRAGWNVATLNPCGNVSYGSTVDFNLVIGTPPACIAPSALTASAFTSNTAVIGWTENGTASEWDVEYGVTGFTPLYTPTTTVNSVNPTLTNLAANTTYQFYVRSKCSLTLNSVWVGPYSFTTTQEFAVVPFTDDFSSVNWSFVNGSQNNKWHIGSATGNTGNSMYISQDGGVNNSYNLTEFSITHAYRNITFPAGTPGPVTYKLDFDWKANGEGSSTYPDDYLSVWIVPLNATLTAGTQITTANTPGALRLGRFLNSNTWVVGESRVIPATFMGDNKLVFEWRNDGGSGSQDPAAIDNVSISLITCPAPTAVTATVLTPTSAELSWVNNSGSGDFEIQYGLASFFPNNGPVIETTSNPYILTGLQPASMYDYYVRTRCSGSDSSAWSGPFRFSTGCDAITAFPWNENFDNMAITGAGIFPSCWVDENVVDWFTTDGVSGTLGQTPYSGTNLLNIGSETNAKIWTPQFELTAGETYEFSFQYAGDTGAGWDGSVYVNTAQSASGATMLGSKFVESGDTTTYAYQKERFCFVPTTTAVYSFGLYVSDANGQDYLSFDDFELKIATPSTGTNGALTVCQTAGPIDLSTLVTTSTTDGTWNNATYQSSITGNLFDLTNVAAGVHEISFITNSCLPQTTVATITVEAKSSAGVDGTLSVCRNEPIDLFEGLTGNVDLGGVWTGPTGAVITNGSAVSSNIPGNYNYQYIVANGSCPSDTAKVIVVVGGCVYVGLEDVAFASFNLYPNPTANNIFITNTGSSEVFNYEVLDINGRVILKADQAINGSTTTELDLSKVNVGVYMIRVFNEKANKTFRIVKN